MPFRSLNAIERGLDQSLDIVKVAKWFLGEGGNKRTLILAGTYGIGKTTVACWLGLHWGNRDETSPSQVGYSTGADIGMVAPWDVATLPCWRDEFAILDDLEGVKDERQRQKVEQILTHRHDHGLWTVATTNLTQGAFVSFVGARVLDRLRMDSTYFWVDGESLRGTREL